MCRSIHRLRDGRTIEDHDAMVEAARQYVRKVSGFTKPAEHNRAAFDEAGTEGAAEWVIFPTAPISKEPLGPVVRQNDDEWFDVVQWTVFSTFITDENGLTSATADAMMDDTPELTRLFGGEGELQTSMGLPTDAFFQVLKQVGSYGEIYQRNLEDPLDLRREGSFNMQWFDGGLIFAPPAR
jgi:general L-amino acid transport system substrate-binding protein